jgi:hypothetical protein
MSAAVAKHTRSAGHLHPVTRSDLESKMRELQGGIEEGKATAASYAIAVGVVVVVGVAVGAFLLGRRKGRKRTTIVEVRRL